MGDAATTVDTGFVAVGGATVRVGVGGAAVAVLVAVRVATVGDGVGATGVAVVVAGIGEAVLVCVTIAVLVCVRTAVLVETGVRVTRGDTLTSGVGDVCGSVVGVTGRRVGAGGVVGVTAITIVGIGVGTNVGITWRVAVGDGRGVMVGETGVTVAVEVSETVDVTVGVRAAGSVAVG